MVTTVNIIGGKWKPILLHMLSSRPMRHGEMRRNIPPISQKVLTQQLRELEADGIVARTTQPTVPPAVEYSLTPYGETLKPCLEALYAWGEKAKPSPFPARLDDALKRSDTLPMPKGLTERVPFPQ